MPLQSSTSKSDILAHLKTISPFTSKNLATDSRYDLTTLSMHGPFVDATDSYVAARLTMDESMPSEYMDADSLAPRSITPGKEMPDLSPLIPSDKPTATVCVDARYLERVAKAAKRFTKGRGICDLTIEVRDPSQPVVFKARSSDRTDLTMLIMPIRQ